MTCRQGLGLHCGAADHRARSALTRCASPPASPKACRSRAAASPKAPDRRAPPEPRSGGATRTDRRARGPRLRPRADQQRPSRRRAGPGRPAPLARPHNATRPWPRRCRGARSPGPSRGAWRRARWRPSSGQRERSRGCFRPRRSRDQRRACAPPPTPRAQSRASASGVSEKRPSASSSAPRCVKPSVVSRRRRASTDRAARISDRLKAGHTATSSARPSNPSPRRRA